MKPQRYLLLPLIAAALWSSAAAFHHEAGEKPKPSNKPAAVSFAPDAKAEKSVETFFRTLAQSLHSRDAKPVVALLAANFTVEGLPAGATQTPAQVFAQAIERVPSPEEFTITSVRKNNEGLTARAELQFPSRVVTRTFKFDPAGKLVSSEFFKINTQPHGGATPPAAPKAAPPMALPPLTTLVKFAQGVEPHPHLVEYLEKIGHAARTGDVSVILPPRDDFFVTNLANVRGMDAMRQALARFGGRLDEITVTARGQVDGGPTMNVTFRNGDQSWPGAFRFDAGMLLFNADLLPPAA